MSVDAFEVYAKIKADTSDFEEKMSGVKGKLGKFGSALTGAAKTAAKVTAAAAVTTGAAVGKILKDSVAAYGEYEQLVGGIRLSLGDAYAYVAHKAKTAYKDVQMSQNQYMRQVNQFSVALRESLEGDQMAAAKLADKMIKAQADLVAATGNSAEMIENAFVGVMRGNYVMLDNLGLGIKPTKEGLQDVIDKVNEWNKTQNKATNYTIDNIADAEAALVDYVEMMHMSGYASAEASGTIQGSMASVKAAWEDLLVGLGDKNADTGQLFKNLFEQIFGNGDDVRGVVENLLPVITQALTGLGEVVANNFVPLVKRVIEIIKENGPKFLKVVGKILADIGDLIKTYLPTLLKKIPGFVKDNLPRIIEAVKDTINGIVGFLSDNLPEFVREIIPVAAEAIIELAAALASQLPTLIATLIDAGLNAIDGIFTALEEKIPGLGFLLEGLTSIVLIGVAAWTTYKTVVAIQSLISTVSTAINALKAATEGQTIAQWAMNAAMNANPVAAVITAIVGLTTAIVLLWNKCEWFRDLVKGMINNIKESFSWLGEQIVKIWNNLIDFIKGIFDKIGGFFNGLWDAIADGIGWIVDKIKGLIGWIQKALDMLGGIFGSATGVQDMTSALESKMHEWESAASGGATGSGGSSAGMPTNIPTNRSVNNSARTAAESTLEELGGGITSSATQYTPTGGLNNSGSSQSVNNSKVVIPVYIGQERIEEIVVDANNRNNYRTGGR